MEPASVLPIPLRLSVSDASVLPIPILLRLWVSVPASESGQNFHTFGLGCQLSMPVGSAIPTMP